MKATGQEDEPRRAVADQVGKSPRNETRIAAGPQNRAPDRQAGCGECLQSGFCACARGLRLRATVTTTWSYCELAPQH